jgi:ChrB-like protein
MTFTWDVTRDRHGRWVLLAYRLPREPSTPRIALWRKLKRLGVVQLTDGLVTLPLDSRTHEALEWIADEVIEAGGEAAIWLAEPSSVRQERELASRMAEAIAAEYRAVREAARGAAGEALAVRRRTLARLRRELHRIRRRDHFPPAERAQAEAAVEELAETLEAVA